MSVGCQLSALLSFRKDAMWKREGSDVLWDVNYSTNYWLNKKLVAVKRYTYSLSNIKQTHSANDLTYIYLHGNLWDYHFTYNFEVLVLYFPFSATFYSTYKQMLDLLFWLQFYLCRWLSRLTKLHNYMMSWLFTTLLRSRTVDPDEDLSQVKFEISELL